MSCPTSDFTASHKRWFTVEKKWGTGWAAICVGSIAFDLGRVKPEQGEVGQQWADLRARWEGVRPGSLCDPTACCLKKGSELACWLMSSEVTGRGSRPAGSQKPGLGVPRPRAPSRCGSGRRSASGSADPLRPRPRPGPPALLSGGSPGRSGSAPPACRTPGPGSAGTLPGGEAEWTKTVSQPSLGHFLEARHYTKYFIHVILFRLTTTLWGRCDHDHFTDEETEREVREFAQIHTLGNAADTQSLGRLKTPRLNWCTCVGPGETWGRAAPNIVTIFIPRLRVRNNPSSQALLCKVGPFSKWPSKQLPSCGGRPGLAMRVGPPPSRGRTSMHLFAAWKRSLVSETFCWNVSTTLF